MLFAALLLVTVYSFPAAQLDYMSMYAAAAGAVLVALMFVYAYAYCTYKWRGRDGLLLLLACCFAAAFLSYALLYYAYGYNPLQIVAHTLFSYFIYAIVILAPFLFISFGVFVWKERLFLNASWLFALALILIAIVFLWYLFLSGHAFAYSVPDDEEFIAINAVHSMLSGQDPYKVSFSSLELFDYMRVNGSVGLPTMTTRNTILGTMEYPALYFISLVPFYLLGQFNTYNVSHLYFIVGFCVYLFILMLVVSGASRKEFLRRPNYVMLLFIVLAVFLVSSITDFLMLALLIIAYMEINSKYIFIILGIVASMQELLWIPVLLFLIYYINNKGLRKGLMAVAGTAVVFLAINGYFIALSPSAFFGSVFAPINGNVLPAPWGAFGYLLLNAYPIPLSSFSTLFYLAVLVSIIAIAYTNDKRLIGLLSLLPFMMLYHGIAPYYSFFLSFFAMSFFVVDGKAKRAAARAKRTLFDEIAGKRAMAVAVAAILLIVVVAAIYVQAQHAAYEGSFNISVSNGTIVRMPNESVYSGILHYSLRNSTPIYFIAFANLEGNNQGPFRYGIINQTILEGSNEKVAYNFTNYSSIINDNRMTLNGSGSVGFSIIIGNSTATAVKCNIYSGDFYYFCPTAATGDKQ